MNWDNLGKVVLGLMLIALLGILAIGPLFRHMNLGLDLQGGVHVVLQAKPLEGKKAVSNEDMDNLKGVMRRRVDELGVSEPLIQREGGDRLIVELAGLKDPEEAVKVIGKTAQLRFVTQVDKKVILTGKDLKDARATISQTDNKPRINLEFNPEGAKVFGQVTSELMQKYPNQVANQDNPNRIIAIYLDEEQLTAPVVQSAITDGKAEITGSFTFEEAASTAALLRGGALPVSVDIMEKRTVGPTLGLDSLQKSRMAVAVGLIAIALFMLIFYRLPGLVADFSLVAYAVLVLGILALLKATLTLPGIAGLLLSVGMAVDANILIYERLKEELNNGKSLGAALDAGFRRAFWTIFDSNLTTLIAAAVLYYFGTGPIRGFAVTLSVGILISMFTAITLTRYLMGMVISVPAFRSLSLYGAKGVSEG